MLVFFYWCFFVFKQKTAYEMRISDWSSDVCSSDLRSMALVHIAFGAGVEIPLRLGRELRAARPVIGNGGLDVGGAEKRGGAGDHAAVRHFPHEIGRASGRERVCQSV